MHPLRKCLIPVDNFGVTPKSIQAKRASLRKSGRDEELLAAPPPKHQQPTTERAAHDLHVPMPAEIGAKKWTPDDEQYLITNYGKIPTKQLAEYFGVTPKSIQAKRAALKKAGRDQLITPPPPEEEPVIAPVTDEAEEEFTPLSKLSKRTTVVKRKAPAVKVEEDVTLPPEYIPTTIMIMTDDGWKPITIDKHRIKS